MKMSMINNITIKVADKNDQEFLFEMLYQSIYYEPGSPKPDRNIVKQPEISKYVENWGKSGDYALIGIDESGNKLGAVWLRYFKSNNKGYGYINDGIPEIGIAVDELYRGKGIGITLLTEILERTKNEIRSISLSVQPNNSAKKLYKKIGFFECGISGDSIIMRYDKDS